MKEYIFQAKYQETMSYFDSHKLPELIRCQDCIHIYRPVNGVAFCKHIKKYVGEDWYCADAEKKEGAPDA